MGHLYAGRTWPPSDRTSVRVAAVHIHNCLAGLSAKGPAVTRRLLQDCHAAGVSIIHADFNKMAPRLGEACHGGFVCPPDHATLGLPSQTGDCCGFILQKDFPSVVRYHGTWDLDINEVWNTSPDDCGRQYPNFLYLNSPAYSKKKDTPGRMERNATKPERMAEKRRLNKLALQSLSTAQTQG